MHFLLSYLFAVVKESVLIYPLGVIVGFESSRVEALEGSEKVILCVSVTEPANAPIEIEFLLEASTLQRSAGNVGTMNYL